MSRNGGALSGKKRGSPERTWRGRSSLLIFQDARGVLSELAPACSRANTRPERGLPGFVGPVPPPLLIRAREYSVVMCRLQASGYARSRRTIPERAVGLRRPRSGRADCRVRGLKPRLLADRRNATLWMIMACGNHAAMTDADNT